MNQLDIDEGRYSVVTLFFNIHPPPELLPVLGPLERYMSTTLDAAVLCSFVVVQNPQPFLKQTSHPKIFGLMYNLH